MIIEWVVSLSIRASAEVSVEQPEKLRKQDVALMLGNLCSVTGVKSS